MFPKGLAALLLSALLVGCQSASTEQWLVGQMELEVGNYRGAIAALEKDRRRRPDHAPTYLSLAAAYTRQGDHEQAAALLTKYLELNPANHTAHLYLGECQLSLGEGEKARQSFQAFLSASKGGPVVADRPHTVHALERLSELSARDTDLYPHFSYRAEALLLRTEMVLEEDTSEAARRLVSSWLDEADAEIAKARELRPTEAAVLAQRLGSLYARLGQEGLALSAESLTDPQPPARETNLPFLNPRPAREENPLLQSMLDDTWRRR